MGECLLTTRGEKGDTGPKGDPGTPTTSSIVSLLGATVVRDHVSINENIQLPAYQGSQTTQLGLPSGTRLTTVTHPIIIIHSCGLTFTRGSTGYIQFSFEAQTYDGYKLLNPFPEWTSYTSISFANKCLACSPGFTNIGFYATTGWTSGCYFRINMVFTELSASNEKALT